jgi:energy-coupling factor transport system ATP-binding protein
MTEPIIVFKDFSFQYNSQSEPTLKKINLTIQSGEKVLIVGPSGSGKSTFAHCLNGLVPNQYAGDITGEAWIAGKKLQETSLFDLSFTTGTVLQDTDGQFIGLTVAEDMAFVLENDGVALAEMREKVLHWAELVDVAEQLDKRPQDLSGGQKQRVSMAGVMINDAPLLLFNIV